MLPPLDPTTGHLPATGSPHACTLDDIHERFVVGAPFEERRQRLFEALRLYAAMIWDIFPDARLRINGGFITHKRWAAPDDVDIAVLCPTATQAQIEAAVGGPLFTVIGAQGKIMGHSVAFSKAHVMGGLIDAFPILPSLPASEATFHRLWSGVTDQNKQPIAGASKGYVEVVNPNAGP